LFLCLMALEALKTKGVLNCDFLATKFWLRNVLHLQHPRKLNKKKKRKKFEVIKCMLEIKKQRKKEENN